MSLTVRNLDISLQGVRVLRDVSFDGADGEFLSLLGASGAGKTTTLKAISGILRPDSGTIEIDGNVVNDLPSHRRHTPVVFQDVRLFPNMSIEENVAFPLKVQGVPRRERIARARELLRFMHLEELGARGIHEVSGGQQQRTALARAIAAEPRVLLLDEPFSGLDESLRDEMRDAVMDVHRTLGITTVLVTHDATEALMLSDRIVYLADGRVVQSATPKDLYEHPATPEVAACFGDCTICGGAIVNGIYVSNQLAVPCAGGCAAECTQGGPATAVIRHRGVTIQPIGNLEVLGSIYCGDTYLVRVNTGEDVLTGRSACAYAAGDRVDIDVAWDSLFVFAETDAEPRPVRDFVMNADEASKDCA